MTQVQARQIWGDRDKRRTGRTFTVDDVVGNYASVTDSYGNHSKIRLDRFKPKYYVLQSGTAVAQPVTRQKSPMSGQPHPTRRVPVPAPVNTVQGSANQLHVRCNKILAGNWGSFGSYAIFDNDKVSVVVREVRQNTFDVKIRLSGHLIYSSVSQADLDTTLGQVRAHLKALRDNISDVVG